MSDINVYAALCGTLDRFPADGRASEASKSVAYLLDALADQMAADGSFKQTAANLRGMSEVLTKYCVDPTDAMPPSHLVSCGLAGCPDCDPAEVAEAAEARAEASR